MNDLATRDGLPDALRVLVQDFPRESWKTHPNFDALTRFWLDRHLMFREVLGRLRSGTETYLDGGLDPSLHAREVRRIGEFFLNELQTHHHMEDHHYFPKLQGLDPRLDAGFGVLDADHHVLDANIHAMADRMNAYLRAEGNAAKDAGGALRESLRVFEGFMDRHLTDEEELIVPIILKHAPQLG